MLAKDVEGGELSNRVDSLSQQLDLAAQEVAFLNARLKESEREARETALHRDKIEQNSNTQLLKAEELVNFLTLKITKLEEKAATQMEKIEILSETLASTKSELDVAKIQNKKTKGILNQNEHKIIALEREKEKLEFEKQESKSNAWAFQQEKEKLKEQCDILEQKLISQDGEIFSLQQFASTQQENVKKELNEPSARIKTLEKTI
ncbi:hypothetical protein HK100_007057, partial [Physocladia obscura]